MYQIYARVFGGDGRGFGMDPTEEVVGTLKEFVEIEGAEFYAEFEQKENGVVVVRDYDNDVPEMLVPVGQQVTVEELDQMLEMALLEKRVMRL